MAPRLHPYVRKRREIDALRKSIQSYEAALKNWAQQPAEVKPTGRPFKPLTIGRVYGNGAEPLTIGLIHSLPVSVQPVRRPVEPLIIGRTHGNGADPMRIGLRVHGGLAGEIFDRLYKPAADKMVIGLIESNLTVPAYSSGQKRPIVKPRLDRSIGIVAVIGQNHAEVAASKIAKSSRDEVRLARSSLPRLRPLEIPVKRNKQVVAKKPTKGSVGTKKAVSTKVAKDEVRLAPFSLLRLRPLEIPVKRNNPVVTKKPTKESVGIKKPISAKVAKDKVQLVPFSLLRLRPLEIPVETDKLVVIRKPPKTSDGTKKAVGAKSGRGIRWLSHKIRLISQEIRWVSQYDPMPFWLRTLRYAIGLQDEQVPRLLNEMGKSTLRPTDVERVIMFLMPQDRKCPQQYVERLCDILTDSIMAYSSKVKFNNGLVGRLIRECELGTAHRLGDALQHKEARIGLHSIGHLVHRLAQHEKHKRTALKFLLWATTLKGEESRTEVLASLAATILHRERGPVRAARHRSDPDIASWELFEPIVRSGIPLNAFIVTAWLRRTCMEGQMRIAIELAKFLETESDIETDNVFFSTLLHGAKLSQSAPVIEKTLEMIAATGVQTPWLYNEVIHALFHHARGESFDLAVDQQKGLPSFAYMVQVYSKIYDMAPLAELIWPVSLDAVLREPLTVGWQFATTTFPILTNYIQRHAPGTLLEPNIPVLTAMVIGLVGNMSMVGNVRSFWDNYRALVWQGHTVACAMVNQGGTRVHDACIRRISTIIVDDDVALRTILGMVDSMLREGFPRPSVYTWNVVLSSHLVRRELQPAVEIVQTMRALGVTPDVETWSKLAIAYADAGEREKYAIVLRLMELEGMPISDHVENHTPRP